MSQLPPPPPGSDVPPPPGEDLPPPPAVDFGSVPPPEEVHENDVLKRRKKFSWRNFGGDGFLVSVAFHVILAIIAIFLIIGQVTGPKKKEVPEEFATGSGGGNNGEKAKSFETKLKQRNPQPMKTPSRIVSKSAGAVSLPDTPATATQNFASGLASGDMSKGAGGGTGGGIGTGNGIGVGNGRNFVSLFGGRNLNGNGLVGTYYDTKYERNPDSDGKLRPSDMWRNPPTWHSPDNISYAAAFPGKSGNKTLDADHYYKLVGEVMMGRETAEALSRYFVSPTRLSASEIWIPRTPSATSPKSFEVEDKCGPHFWVVSYRGKVSPPTTGRWRFVGCGDDVLGVKINGKPVLAWYWWFKPYLHHVWEGAPKSSKGKPDTSKLRHYLSPVAANFNVSAEGNPGGAGVSDWVDLTKGRWYDIEIILADWGGEFNGFLLCEKEGDKYEKTASIVPGESLDKIYLFRTSDEMPAPAYPGMPDYARNSPFWGVRPPEASRVR